MMQAVKLYACLINCSVYKTVLIDSKVDEDTKWKTIAPNTYRSSSSRYGRKAMPVHYIYWNIYSLLA